MKYIELTQGYSTIVDNDVFNVVSKYNWCAVRVGGSRSKIYADNLKLGKLHRFIFEKIDGVNITGKQIDHIDGNGLNNLRENLRVVTARENSRNQKSRKVVGNKNSNYIGVTWREHAGRWWSRIKYGEKQIHLGYFDTAEEAGMAYDRAVLYYFPEEDSVLNFPNRKNEHDLSVPYERQYGRIRKTNTTGYKGVHEVYNGYSPSLGIGGRKNKRRLNLGVYKDKEVAAQVYDICFILVKGYIPNYLNFPNNKYTDEQYQRVRDRLKQKYNICV